jgi:hypothetical protein
MPDWKDYIKYFKDFFETLAGKLTAILAFALLVIVALGWFGASIPADFKWLVYIVVIGAMLIFAVQAIAKVAEKRRAEPSAPVTVPQPAQPMPQPTAPPVDSLTARERYLRAVMDDSRALRLVGLDPQAADPQPGRADARSPVCFAGHHYYGGSGRRETGQTPRRQERKAGRGAVI